MRLAYKVVGASRPVCLPFCSPFTDGLLCLAVMHSPVEKGAPFSEGKKLTSLFPPVFFICTIFVLFCNLRS